jgi:hypothetical protein
MADHTIAQLNLLQEGVSCAAATLSAIEGAELFRVLPEGTIAKDHHNHGCFLLSMLGEHLRRLQQQVDAMDAAASAVLAEG